MGWISNKRTGWLLRVLVIGLLVCLGWAGGAPVEAADTVSIGTAEELIAFAVRVNDGEADLNGVLTADIELNKEINDNSATNWMHWGEATPPDGLKPWIPIGTDTNPYAGTFDGAGHTVSGIYINAPSVSYQGLFGYGSGLAIISNLGVVESYISGKSYTGGVAGYMYGTLSNCFYRGTVKGDTRVGGVAGIAKILIKCFNSGVVSGDYYVGGVTGMGTNISNCYNTGAVSGTASTGNVGGITGRGTNINNSFNTGTVTGNDAGQVLGSVVSEAIVSNCYYQADVASTGIGIGGDDVAGVVEFKTPAAFTSGEVAWRLQGGQPDPAEPVWGQQLSGGDALPLLKITDQVYQLTLMKGDDSLYGQSYRNAVITTLPVIEGISWKDVEGTVYTTIAGAGDYTLYPWLTALPTPEPTATAVYGTKLGDIPLSSDPGINWDWNWPAGDQDQILAVGNDRGFSARYRASDGLLAIFDVDIVPVISPRSLIADGVVISQPPNVTYSGAAIEPKIDVTDSGAAITAADYTISYDKNITPGTATVTITGQVNYQGEVVRTFTIAATGGGGGYTPPAMSGITVTPGVVSFDPSGQLAVDISGLPAGAKVFYSLDGITYSTTPPAITRAGEYPLYLRISCYGYQEFDTQTLVRVAKQSPPKVSQIPLLMSPQQQHFTLPLGPGLPINRGQTQYQVGEVEDPDGLLDGPPTIAADGAITCNFRRPLSAAADATSHHADAGLATAARTATITVLVTMENYEDTTLTVVVSEAEPVGVRYQTHIQDYGWENDWTSDGELSGTVSESKRLEALKIELTGDVPAGASIETAVHVQNQGDLGPFAMGSEAGTSGLGLRLERITLALNNLPGYTLYYNVHVQNRGWLRDEDDPGSWFVAGESAGTSGQSLRLEAIRIKLVKDE